MADERKQKLPWGMNEKELKPNSVKSLPKSTLEAFSIGMTNPGLKKNVFQHSREEKEKKKKREDEETAKVLEEFVTTFEEPSKAKMTFVRGAVINPDKDTMGAAGTLYQPAGIVKSEPKPEVQSILPSAAHPAKPPKKKEKEKKKSVLEMFGDELKRIQDERRGRQSNKSGDAPLVMGEEERDSLLPGPLDKSDALSTNLYVGNINPKMTEEMMCQHFGKFGPLASIKIMWPRTEEERLRNRNCGFVAFMKRKDAEKALDSMKGSTILGHEVEIGWGKIVPLPPTPFYVAPDNNEERNAFVPDPPSGFPFNAQPISKRSRSSGRGSYNNMPPPGSGGGDDHYDDDPPKQSFEERLYNSIIKVVLPNDKEVLRLIHRMIEFIIREGPMFEAMIMNKEMSNPKFRFLFDNQCPEHTYYRWKMFSILQGDSPETWKTEEFRMFENGSLWRPPPLKNLRGKVLPPIMEIVKRGQLPQENRNHLEEMLRSISMTRPKIKEGMIWCLEHAESSDEIVDCITESLSLSETPLPLKLARLFLVIDILQNCNAHVSCAARYRRGFEGKLLSLMEHFHDIMKKIDSRLRMESFKRRVLRCLQSLDQLTVYHFNFIDKLREQFIGKTQEEIEKKRAFDTVAALMSLTGAGAGDDNEGAEPPPVLPTDEYKPIDFSGGHAPFVVDDDIDGDPLPDPDVDGVPIEEDLDGVPMDDDVLLMTTPIAPPTSSLVQSKWELVDYGRGSSSSEEEESLNKLTGGNPSHSGGDMRGNSTASATASDNDTASRQQLREIEIKVLELMEALESSGSYTQQEIQEKSAGFREKLLKEIQESGRGLASLDSPPPSKKEESSDRKVSRVKDTKSRRRSRDIATPPRDRSRSPASHSSSKRKHSSPSSSRRHKSRHKSPGKSGRSRSPHKRRHRSKSPHSRSRSPSSRRHAHPRSPSPSSHKAKKRR